MSPSAPGLSAKLDRLRALLRQMESVLVCYSGGIDSAFLLAVAHAELGDRAVGLTAVSPSLAPSEHEAAIENARRIGARHELVPSHEMDRPEYVRNEPDRCFHCKTELYTIAQAKSREWGLAVVVNGANLDDLGDYRPGLDAARHAGARSPLVEAELGKADVREAARLMGLDIWDKPAAACLSSRLPYGTPVTTERLAQIGGFEAALRALGLRQVRVRWHDTVARIEVGVPELRFALEHRDPIVVAGKAHGFKYVTLDLCGYRTGSHNEVLVGRSLKLVD